MLKQSRLVCPQASSGRADEVMRAEQHDVDRWHLGVVLGADKNGTRRGGSVPTKVVPPTRRTPCCEDRRPIAAGDG